MANIKFSDFTASAAIDQTDSFLVGFDNDGGGASPTNNKWTFPEVAAGLPTLYAGDGTLSGNRNVNLGTNNLGFTNGKVGVGLASPLYTFETRATVTIVTGKLPSPA